MNNVESSLTCLGKALCAIFILLASLGNNSYTATSMTADPINDKNPDIVDPTEKRVKRRRAVREQFRQTAEKNPDILEQDKDDVWDHRTNSLDESKLQQLISDRRAGLARYPGTIPADFRYTGAIRENDNEIQKYVADRKGWTEQYPHGPGLRRVPKTNSVPQQKRGFPPAT